ncbi:MAG: TIGR03905 family TSCPD domain-containing protein [Synergistaceae bacterium]|nr:TIGR03905 family TSCPD domain-containing protein [Synergistaceae bacterium]
MKELIEFTPSDVCTKKITFELEDGKIYNLKFHGGCPGNLGAIARLLEGADAVHTAMTLRGNPCGSRATSCADQLAIAIEQAINSQELGREAIA